MVVKTEYACEDRSRPEVLIPSAQPALTRYRAIIKQYAPTGPYSLYMKAPVGGPASMATFIATELNAAPLLIRSLGNMAPINDLDYGIGKRRAIPTPIVIANIGHMFPSLAIVEPDLAS